MNSRVALCALCFVVACDSAKEEDSSKKDAGASDKAEAKTDKDEKPSEDVKPSTEKDEKPSEAPDTAASKECPKELKGAQEGDVVITKACGAVPVTATYKVNGSTLTLEAGATLEFADGAELQVGYYEPAKLIVQGTASEPVMMTSKGDKAAGVWKGVRLYSKAARSSVTGLVLEYAGEDKHGALKVDAPDVRVEKSKFQHLKGAGIVTDREASFAAFTDNSFTDVGKVAIRLPANVVGGLGIGNTYDEAARIVVPGGSIKDDAHWMAQGVAVQIGGEVKVNGEDGARAKLSLDPGTRLEFGGSGRIVTGYYGEATLEARGSKDKPIVFTSSDREEAGSWRGVFISGKGEGDFEHVEFNHGGKDEREGVLKADGAARLSVEQCTFNKNTTGVVLRGAEVKLTKFANNTFTATPGSVRVNAAVMGGVGDGNTYDAGSVVVVENGRVNADATWALQPGAQVQMDGNLQVSGGKLELPAGYTLAFKDGASMTVGYYDTGSLIAQGTADKPITFSGQRDEAGAWKGLSFHSKASANDVKNLVLRNTAAPALKIDKSASGTVDGVKCETCAGEVVKKADGSSFEVKNAQ
ncbi:MAG: hypothetical protein ACRBN8_12525 [Nannocystales bacterium]